MRDVFVEKGHTFLAVLDDAAPGKPVDMQEKFFEYTMDSIMLVFFGRKTDTLQGAMDEFAHAFDAIQRFQMKYFDFFPLIILSEILPYPLGCSHKGGDGILMKWHRGRTHCAVEWKKCNDILTKVSYDIIDNKRKDPQLADKKDLLARFMNASNEDGISLSDPVFQSLMRDIVLSLIIAGRDTTACTLTWVFYLLSQNPKVQELLLAEIDDTLKGAEPTYENLTSLAYLHGVIYETLRLFPPVPSDFKIAVSDDVLPDGTQIPKYTRVNYVPYSCGRNPERYEDPEAMKPERWFKYDEEQRRNRAIIPNQFEFPVFQAGPRICLGMNMALMEAKIVIVMLLQKYTFTLPKEEADKITYSRMITLSLKNGDDSHSLWMHARRRDDVSPQ
jgi:fatty acid omega-hydroxylase